MFNHLKMKPVWNNQFNFFIPDAYRKIKIKPLKETSVGVAQV